MASGNFGGGNGTAASPYMIEDIIDLNELRGKSEHYELSRDINMNIWPFNVRKGWDPIDDFRGHLNGRGYKIKGLFINRPEESNVGLFGSIATGRFEKLVLEDVNIKGQSSVGALVGRIETTSASNMGIFECRSSGEIEGNSQVGGLVGRLYGQGFSVDNCYSSCSISASSSIVGGIVGYSYDINASIEWRLLYNRCLFFGEIVAQGSNIGGIAGYSRYPRFLNCYYTAEGSNNGLSVTEEELKNLEIIDEQFNQQTEDNFIWHFDARNFPILSFEIFPSEDPRVILRAEGQYYKHSRDKLVYEDSFEGESLSNYRMVNIGLVSEPESDTYWTINDIAAENRSTSSIVMVAKQELVELNKGDGIEVIADYLGLLGSNRNFSGLSIYDESERAWYVAGIANSSFQNGIYKFQGGYGWILADGKTFDVTQECQMTFTYMNGFLRFYVNGEKMAEYETHLTPSTGGLATRGQFQARYNNLKMYSTKLAPAGSSLTKEIIDNSPKWQNFNKEEPWKRFAGEIEVAVYSDKENPLLDLIIVSDQTSEDQIEFVGDVTIESLSSDVVDKENLSVVLVATDEIGLEGSGESVRIASFTSADVGPENINISLEATAKTDTTKDAGSIQVRSSESVTKPFDETVSIVTQGANNIDTTSETPDLDIASAEYTDKHTTPDMEMVGTIAAQSRYVLSIDGGNEWMSYDGKQWFVVPLEFANSRGMTRDFLNSLDFFDYEKLVTNRIYLNDVKIAAQFSSHYENGKVIISDVRVEYFDNQAPFVESAQLNLDTIHNEYAVLQADLVDLEDDQLTYKILIRRAGESNFSSIDPMNNTDWFRRRNGDTIRHAYNHPYFNTGMNTIRLQLRDERGREYQRDFPLYLQNEQVELSVSYDRYKMDMVINDADGDDASYRMWINGKLIFDWTEYFPTPSSAVYRWKSGDLKLGEQNHIQIEVKDTIGEITSAEFNIQGHRNGLLFKDEHGELYTTELAELIKELDMGVIVGGLTSIPTPVDISNETGLSVKDLKVGIESGTEDMKGVYLQISEQEMPFEPKKDIRFKGQVSPEETRRFYARVETTERVNYTNDFTIQTSADVVDK